MSSALYERMVRPLLFRLEPETAHDLARAALSRALPWSLLPAGESERLKRDIGPWTLSSPIGLAAGFDKNGDAIPGLQHLGFSYISVGSILPAPSAGNPRPRLIRYPASEALANCYGLPSDGIDACVVRFKRLSAQRLKTRLIANLHAEGTAEYCRCFAAIAPYVDGIELGLRCPNRDDMLSLYPLEAFDELFGALRRHKPDMPLIVKLPPYFNERERDNRFELVERAVQFGLTALTIQGNWTIDEAHLSRGRGSLSGRPTFANNLKVASELVAVARGRIAIKASGGVHSGADAFALLRAGVAMIDIFTAFIYRGWNTAAKIKRELLAEMDASGIASVADLGKAEPS